MAETSFEVRYDGEALRDRRMPVRDLAPALLALGQLFTEASQLLYPENDPVSLEIEATREGSFEVELILRGAGIAWDQLSTNPVESAAALVVFKEIVIGNSVDPSLFGLIKWLRNKLVKQELEGPEPGEVTLRTGDGSEITVKAEIAALNRDPQIRRKIREVVEPLRREGVNKFEVRSDAKSTVELGKDDVPAFEIPEVEEAEIVSQEEIDVYLDVFMPDLEKGGTRKWRFGGLGETFAAPIEDAEFMEKVNQHKEVFGVGDQLRSRLQIIQKRDPGTGKIRAERRVVKVYECIKGPEQLALKERTEQVQKRLGGDDERPLLAS